MPVRKKVSVPVSVPVSDSVSGIRITGQQRCGRYLVRVDGAECWLTRVPFGDFCKLAAACITENVAGVEFERKRIKRLREKLNDAMGDDEFGESLIRPMGSARGKSRYLLDRTSDSIRVEAPFRTALVTAQLKAEIANLLRAHCAEK